MTASHPAPAHVLSRIAPSFLAADVGGTHVRVARVQASGDAAHPVQVLEYRKYRNADHAGLSAILSDFLGEGPRPTHCVVASAGYAREDGTVITANLPWPLSARQVEADVGLQRVFIVNDFEAVAYAAAQVDASGVLHLCGPETAARGPTLVVGPGTGLGAALWIPTAHGPVVLPTEAGQPTPGRQHRTGDGHRPPHAARPRARVDRACDLRGTAARGPTLVVGPGTGLGAALWIPPRTARWCSRPKPANLPWPPAPNWRWPSSATCSATARTCRSSMRSPARA